MDLFDGDGFGLMTNFSPHLSKACFSYGNKLLKVCFDCTVLVCIL